MRILSLRTIFPQMIAASLENICVIQRMIIIQSFRPGVFNSPALISISFFYLNAFHVYEILKYTEMLRFLISLIKMNHRLYSISSLSFSPPNFILFSFVSSSSSFLPISIFVRPALCTTNMLSHCLSTWSTLVITYCPQQERCYLIIINTGLTPLWRALNGWPM